MSEAIIKGKCFGVKFISRGGYGNLLQLLIEDDENWIEKDFMFDEYWLDDLIEVLTMAKQCKNAKLRVAHLLDELKETELQTYE